MSEEIEQLKAQEPQKVQNQTEVTTKKSLWKKIIVSSTIASVLLLAFLVILFLVILPSQQTSYIRYEDESTINVYDPETKQAEQIKVTRMKYVHRRSSDNDDDDLEDGQQFEIKLVQAARQGRQLQQDQNSDLSCLHSEIGKTTTYVQCNDGSIQIINQDLSEVFEGPGIRLLTESFYRTLQDVQNTDNSTQSYNSTINNTVDNDQNITVVQLDNGLEAQILPVSLVEVNSTVVQNQSLSGEVPVPEDKNNPSSKRFLQMFEQNFDQLFQKQYGHLSLGERQRMLGFISKIAKQVTNTIQAVGKAASAVIQLPCKIVPPLSCGAASSSLKFGKFSKFRGCTFSPSRGLSCAKRLIQVPNLNIPGRAIGGIIGFFRRIF